MIKSSFGRRRRLTCFFCGHSTSIVTREPYVKSFTCTSPYCQSVNHLDEQGNIVDYIPSPQQTSVPPPAPRYGRAVRSTSPPPSDAAPSATGRGAAGSNSPVFCRPCEKHLAIKNELLAEYLPPEDDPEFDLYWEKLPEFKRQLEERYPEPCEPCAAKAQVKIKQANYLARTALVRNFLEQSENMKPSYHREPWGWSRVLKLVFWLVRGVGWYGVHALVVVWHVVTILYPIPLHDQADITGTWGQCLSKSSRGWKVDLSCYEVVSILAKKVLPWSWLFLCWNYLALAHTRKPKATVSGNAEYVRCEVILFLVRMVAWLVLTPGRIKVDVSPDALKAWSYGFLMLAVVGFAYDITALKLVEPKRINLRESISPPDTQRVSNGPVAKRTTRGRAPSPPPRQPYFAPAASPKKSHSIFPPISSFEKQPLQSSQTSYDSPFSSSSRNTALPPPQQQKQFTRPRQQFDDDDDDEMDWDPSSPQKKPPNLSSASNNLQSRLNPFAARIPAAPPSSMFQSFVRGSTQQQLEASGKRDRLATSRESFFHPSVANGGVSSGTSTKNGGVTYPPMAEAKFFPRTTLEREDTGLEGLMSGGLRLEDEPDVIKAARAEHRHIGVERDTWWEVLGRVVLAGSAGTAWVFLARLTSMSEAEVAQTVVGPMPDPRLKELNEKYAEFAKLGSLAFALLSTVWKLIRKQSRTPSPSPAAAETISPWDMEKLLLAAEAMTGVMLLIFTAGGTNKDRADLLGKMYLGWVLAREVWNVVVLIQSPKPPMRPQQEEPLPSRGREISPGLGDWPLPPEKRNARKMQDGFGAPGGGSEAVRANAQLRKDGSSSYTAFGGLRKENSAGMGGGGGLAGMVRDAEKVPGMVGAGTGGRRFGREMGGRGGGGGFGGAPTFQKNNSAGFAGLRL